MNSNIAQIVLIVIILVATVGVFFVASACGGAGMQALLGMNMKGCLSALTHPILAFSMIFAAVAVAMGALTLVSTQALPRPLLSPRATEAGDATRYKNLNNKRRNSRSSRVGQLISRGIFQKREDSDDSH